MPRYKIADIAMNSTEKRTPTSEDMDTYIGLEHLEPGSLCVTRWGSSVPIKGDKLIMRKGDVLFGKRNAYLRRTAISPHDGLFSAHGMILRPNEEVINANLFPFFLSSKVFYDEAIRISVGSLSPTINWRDLAELEFNLPPIEEQVKLAELLWAFENTKEAHKSLLAKSDELVEAEFIDIFGDPLKNTMHWPEFKIGDICYVTKLAGFEYTNYIHYENCGDVIMVKGLNVKEKHLVLEELSYISANISDSLPRSQLHEGDVVMTYIGINIGDVAIVDRSHRYHLAPNVAKISPLDKSRINPVFLVNLLYYSRPVFVNEATNTAKAALNMDRIRKISTFVPPINLQNKFADFVESTDKSKLVIQQSLESLEQCRNGLMKKVFG